MLSVSSKKAAHIVGAFVVASLAMGLTSSVVYADQGEVSADFMAHGNIHHSEYSPLVKKVHDATAGGTAEISISR